jgi:DNA-binding transcriptional regulator YiaG
VDVQGRAHPTPPRRSAYLNLPVPIRHVYNAGDAGQRSVIMSSDTEPNRRAAISVGANYASRIRIRALRATLGLTQERLVVLLGVSFASVNRWEKGKSRPSALTWRKIVEGRTVWFGRADEPRWCQPRN